jgi:predicted HicB family RNase H-like nuclease
MISTMNYKNYTAKIIYDERDEIFVGRVLYIQDIIGFDGSSVEELKNIFASTMEAYFEDCADLGREPNQPQKPRRTRHLPSEKIHRKSL